MLARRTLLGTAGASLATVSLINQASAAADKPKAMPGEYIPRGVDGRLRRLATLDLESQQDFTLGFRQMHSRAVRTASGEMFARALAARGIDPATPITRDQLREIVEAEPAINLASKTWLANQQITWKTLQDHFHKYADVYLTEMEMADKTGPGKLELNPALKIPDSAKHEIHIQPGGYVGDPFAGHIYHYGTNSFYAATVGYNEQDQIQQGMAERLPLPKDGKVKRILDMGCGTGQLTLMLKERFPDAEVWGVDAGGPMVRYAHMRANSLGNGTNFAQRMAEDTKFPDNYFDIVTSYLLHHEVPGEDTRKIVDEARRVTRPGGVYYPIDFVSGGTKMIPNQMYGRWWDHRWNNEVWSFEYHAVDFNGEIAKRGFNLEKNAKAVLPGFGIRHAVKA